MKKQQQKMAKINYALKLSKIPQNKKSVKIKIDTQIVKMFIMTRCQGK